VKIVSTDQLYTLVRSAKRRGYNRQIDLGRLRESVDPSGIHVLKDWMLHEHKAGVQCEPHVRCEVYIKVADRMEPATAWLDVELEQFNRLTDSKVAEDAIAAASSMDEGTPDHTVVGTV